MQDLSKLNRPLSIEEIDFRVQSINKGGYATILAYKDARVDMNRLDEVVGPLGWRREHLNGNANCIISIWDNENKHWVSKEDTGSESQSDSAKGLASDSFKRAAFNWGIGRELYDYPVISIKLNADEFTEVAGKIKQSWNLRLREWTWFSQFNEGKLNYIACKDDKGVLRFNYGKFNKEAK